MPELKVRIDHHDLHLHVVDEEEGDSLKDILDHHGIVLPSDCGGVGKCGLCLVHIDEGECTQLTLSEQGTLSADEIGQGCRLACQARPLGDVTLAIHQTSHPAIWSDLETGKSGATASESDRLGVAIDLGTTQIRATLWNLDSGERMDGITSLNPQAVFGADVLNRLSAAKASNADAARLSRLAESAIAEAIQILTARHDVASALVVRVTVVANTAMLALLAGRNYEHLLEIEQWQKPVDCQPATLDPWRKAWGVASDADIVLVQPLAGFVGSDLLAAVLAFGLIESGDAALLIDFGTNSEVALWDGRRLWVTSVPGGPAFEGSGLSCGMPIMAGAIQRISAAGSDAPFELDVIGGGTARGVCGSGLVDAIAHLLRRKVLNRVGRLAEPFVKGGFPLDEAGNIRINNRDVDLFQRAKGATAAATLYLLEQAGLKQEALKRVCITGAFGSNLDCRHASEIGLIPDISPDTIELHYDSALSGCEALLLSHEQGRRLELLREQARLINMSMAPEFDMLFVDSLFLRPLPKSGIQAGSVLE
ncbi:2Fe-2S iron-sulfur cluster binding domain-containing protein [Mariprofundus ferrinatatus]|uniref:2Fe-2S iron-sulfur cluster binding domain-containing protein n=1 Tax=Mariprofundus ferrinatatus TaxID=1921087 RepID=A0A2K8L6Z3_9PROT|nr:ASKHA domain-containing protein [Mariprofundus ferrinatatus]ATX82882.1 2Fe-2S iron-sulfur cluster binding domain-containing protein [Mariprofundus ferrinatatus]